MTAQPVQQKTPKRFFARPGLTSRSISIILAFLANANLIFLLFRKNWNGATDIEPFWLQQFVAFAIYGSLQQWTLAYQAGRGDEFAATIDKIFAASPAIVTALIQVYWMGHGTGSPSWRQHVVSVLWSMFAIADFFATDITNQRLRTRQLNLSPGE